MDAVAYQMSFDKEQLALLCANYDRCIDSLGAENNRLKDENAKLRNAVLILVHCMSDVDGCDSCPINGNPYDVQGKWSACDALREMLLGLGIEVKE